MMNGEEELKTTTNVAGHTEPKSTWDPRELITALLVFLQFAASRSIETWNEKVWKENLSDELIYTARHPVSREEKFEVMVALTKLTRSLREQLVASQSWHSFGSKRERSDSIVKITENIFRLLPESIRKMIFKILDPEFKGAVTMYHTPTWRIWTGVKGEDFVDHFPKATVHDGNRMRRSRYLKGKSGGQKIMDLNVISQFYKANTSASVLVDRILVHKPFGLDVELVVRNGDGNGHENEFISAIDPKAPVLNPYLMVDVDEEAIVEISQKLRTILKDEDAVSIHSQDGKFVFHRRPKVIIYTTGRWEVPYQ